MKKSFLITVCSLLISMVSCAQEHEAQSTAAVLDSVVIEAEFPGGDAAWVKFLQQNLKTNVPTKNKAPKGTYIVMVHFIVLAGGGMDFVGAETNHGYGMEKEVVRVIKQSPKWIPAMKNGKAVDAYRRQPITFVVK